MDSLLPTSADISGVKALKQAKEAQSGFLVIGIVGAAGAGTSWTARVLIRLLQRREVTASIVTARKGFEAASREKWKAALERKTIDPIGAAGDLQAIGDHLRKTHDNAFVATSMIAQIAEQRAGQRLPSVVVCDSLRHPAEAHLLRMVYGDAFWLLGTVCDSETRFARLTKKLTSTCGKEPSPSDVRDFIGRDQDSPDKHGQHVAATFEIADYFVETSALLRDPDVPDTELDAWPVTADLA